MIQIPSRQERKRRLFDGLYNRIICLSSRLSVFVLTTTFVFIFFKGFSPLGTDLLKGSYRSKNYLTSAETTKNHPGSFKRPSSLSEETPFPSKQGTDFVNTKDQNGDAIVLVEYTDEAPPFHYTKDESIKDKDVFLSMEVGSRVENLGYRVKNEATVIVGSTMSQNVAKVAQALDSSAQGIAKMCCKTLGSGIHGSTTSALYLILISLLILLPLGAASVTYLREYARPNRLTSLTRDAIEVLAGMPSIVFGLMGIAALSPIAQPSGTTTANILLGNFTIPIVLLPIVIRSTEEALIAVPQSLWDAPLSVDTNQPQTIFKVVLLCAVPEILIGILLNVGRAIGGGVALIYTTGTYVDNTPALMPQGTSPAVHIYNIINSEQPNFELAGVISVVTLMFVLILNIYAKLLSKKSNKS